MDRRQDTDPEVWVAVADLHGHPAHFEALLDHLDGELGTDYRLVALGDYVDNGPDIPGLFDLLIQTQRDRGDRFVPILGNHDYACLRTLGWPGTNPDPKWYTHWGSFWSYRGGLGSTPGAYEATSAATLAERMPAEHIKFLESLPWYFDTGQYFFVHCGLELGPIPPQRVKLEAKELPKVHVWTPHPLRNRDQLAIAHDEAWDRVVVSAHTKKPATLCSVEHPHSPHFIAEQRICLSGEIDQTGVLYAVVLPERRIVAVELDLTVSSSHPAVQPGPTSTTVSLASAKQRVLEAGGKIRPDTSGLGRTVLKLPIGEEKLAQELRGALGAELRSRFNHVLLVPPSQSASPTPPRSASVDSAPSAPPAQPRVPLPPDPSTCSGFLSALTTGIAGARVGLLDGGGRRATKEVRQLVEEVEAQVAKDPGAAFTFDMESGRAELVTRTRCYAAGRFETRSIGDLRAELAARREGERASVRLSVLVGNHPLCDIGTLQAGADDASLFQVASQFNCLEAPSARIVPVRKYLDDPTQGPRASISTFPGTLLRHYAAPGADGRFIQEDGGPQINLLADVLDPDIAKVRCGYLVGRNISDATKLATALENEFDKIRVGVHDGVEVVLGHDWGGPVPNPPPRIAQVFTSTVALGGYTSPSVHLEAVCRPLLRAAYLGTLLAALSLGKRCVVLTLIGGGAFGNSLKEIWNAIAWSLGQAEELASSPLDVVINARDSLGRLGHQAVLAEIERRGGVLVDAGCEGITISYDFQQGRGASVEQ